MGRDDDDNDDVGTDGGWVDLARAHPVRDDDPSVGRDLARGIPPGRSRGPLADLARAVVEALGGDRREAAS